MFPLAFWNVYNRTALALLRTNNSVETFHNMLTKSVSNYRPSIETGGKLSYSRCVHFERGGHFPKIKKYADISARVKLIVDNYRKNS